MEHGGVDAQPPGHLAHAVACGFTSPSHFTRRFRQAYGLPPGEWQRRAADG